MTGFVPSWLTIAQCVVAGLVVGLCALHWGWWRGDMRKAGTVWTLAWSMVLAAVLLVDGLLALVPEGPAVEVMITLRFATLAAAVILSFPAVHAYTDGPGVRGLVLATVGWYALATALWLGTDLIYRHEAVDGIPVYGPLVTAVNLLPLVGAGVYVSRGVRGLALTPVGAVVTVSGFFSSVLLIAASVPPPSAATEALYGLWVVPLIVGLQVLAGARISTVRREAARRAVMREALASVANAAWFVRSPDHILERARDECRTVLNNPTIEGTLRPLARDRFVTEFYSPGGRPVDPDEQAFLRDLARVVSGAAERQALTTRLRRAAFTDSLTSLHNRHALDKHLMQTLQRATVERTRVAVLYCDLDGFKLANDRHGHEWGDQLLIQTAAHLERVLGPDTFIARHGGDEFVVVVERADEDAALCLLARRLREEFVAPGDQIGAPTLTVGVPSWEPNEVLDPAALVRHADLAMLEGKRSHSGVALYDARLRAQVTEQTALRRALENGISDGDIVAHFQPLTDAITLEVVGLEALARWRRDGRLRQPAEWLGFAEESGLILEVGRQIFRAARVGMERFDLPVAVNVAARQLDEPDFVEQVELAWGTDAWDRLTIEVTESALLYDAAHVRASLTTLAERGVKIAIDDFGTGYNSLSRLGELPLHILKIDRTFVQDIRRPEGAAVLRAIIALAEAHGLEVVAEGVEHAEELSALVAMGVGTVQGHMLGRPAAGLPIRGARSQWASVPSQPQPSVKAASGTAGRKAPARKVKPAVSA